MRIPLLLALLLFTSCASVGVTGEGRIRLEKIGTIEKKCQELNGEIVKIRAKFMGWGCPPECGGPPVTRSDTCFIDDTGCIYAYGRAGLDPITDKGKELTVTAKVVYSQGKCYIKVIETDEVK